ncbi:T9SS type A sorting domain-containing protein [Edaphocola aurantiacus]|uniref:T9SS type A sorting domain-containing protein n=1 Tax=Edaphocola aurantiacus TaxID=2601682 RepID=UPI001C95A474|nr:T9SS type A sorting domain-containing protein [Edaphocola aurantiacus]
MMNSNTGLIAKSPSVSSKNTAETRTIGARLSKLKVIAGAAFMMLTSALTASATLINSTVSCTQTTTATSSCVNGFFASGWTSNNGYWTYSLNTTGFTGITMSFNTTSSGTGPTKGYVYYNIGASDVLVDSYTVNTSCALKTFTLPSACDNKATLQIKLKMANASAAGGTNRVPSNGVFDGTNTTGCSGTPVAGTASSNKTAVCGSDSVLFTLSGGASGTSISYQWQSSPNGTSSWTNISGATGLTYKGFVSSTTYYRAVTTCTGSGLSANSNAQQVTVNPLPSVNPISGGSSTPLLIGQTTSLSNTTPGGIWSSSNTSVATVNASGLVTAVSGGTAVIRYTVEASGCENAATSNVNVVWPNTLALYAGYNGSNTNVITIAGETAGTLTAHNFTTLDTPSTQCASGGLSGLNILPSVTAYNSATGPYISYVLTPDAGKALNITRISAKTRESDSSAQKARIAYRVNGGPWIDENRDVVQSRGGSCGANSNVWDFTLNGANPTVNGITGTLEVAVFPYNTSTKYGTFQLNSLEVYGTITNSTPCAGTPAAGSVTPSVVNICDTGSRWLNFAGVAGVGISYQWQKSTDNVNFTDISGATNATYNTGTLVAGVAPAINYYRVKTICSASGLSAFSPADTVNVNSTGSLGSFTAPDFLYIGTPVTITAPVSGGRWSSNDTSVASIDSISGAATPHIPGDAVFTYSKTTNGCTARSRDTINVVYPNTIAAYIGKNGNSTNVNAASGYTVTPLANVGFDTAQKCTNGGLSGLKKDGLMTYSDLGPHVSFMLNIGSATPIDITGFYATLRRSNSGISKARLAYNLDGSFWYDGGELSVQADDCGYSSTVLSHPDMSFLTGLVNTNQVEFAIYGYGPIANGGTLQVNAIDITATGSAAYLSKKVMIQLNNEINVYPNPATNVLNIVAQEAVNVNIFSIEGKQLINAANTTSVDVSRLAAGTYMAQVRSAANNTLIKTVKFTKQ